MTLFVRVTLLGIPVLLLIVGAAMSLKMFPLYSGGGIFNSDPSYAYLFNGLLLLAQQVPHHIDHPGTPLQTLIALLVYLQWLYLKLFNSIHLDVVTAAMAEPERYLLLISRVLLVLNVSALLFLGKRLYQSTGSIFLTLFCQSALLTYGVFGSKLLYPAPEALVSCLSLCMLAVLSPLIFQNTIDHKKQTKIALATGLIFGIGFAVKLTFLPLVGLFFLLQTWRYRLVACIAALFGWLLGIFPIITKLPGLFNWAYNMMTHTGKYGAGTQGFFDHSQLVANFVGLFKAFPFFYITIFVFSIYLLLFIAWFVVVRRPKTSDRPASSVVVGHTDAFKIIAILLIVCIAQTLMVLKHFGQHYMIPALPIAFIGSALLLRLLFERKPQLQSGLKTVIAVGMAVLVVQANYTAVTTLRAERIQHNRSVVSLQKELARHANPIVIGSYGCYLPQCGVLFGIEYAPAIDKKVGPFLANFYGFNVWNNMLIIDGHGFYPLTVLQPLFETNRPIFLITQIDFPAFEVFKKELILTAEDQKLYKITGLVGSQ